MHAMPSVPQTRVRRSETKFMWLELRRKKNLVSNGARVSFCRRETRPDLQQHGRNLTKQVEEISFHAVIRFH